MYCGLTTQALSGNRAIMDVGEIFFIKEEIPLYDNCSGFILPICMYIARKSK